MIEFNLLPDIKLKFIKARRLKRLVTTVSFIVGAAALTVFVLLLIYADVVQKNKINSNDNKISTSKQQLTGDSNLNKILTIQNQLASLPGIEQKLPVTSRLYTYLGQLVPTSLTISDLGADFTQNTINITGNADSLTSVNQFIDTLKYSTFSDQTDKNTDAFSNVVLQTFSYSNQSSSTNAASYTVEMSFNPKLFMPADNATLTVPNATTTRSLLDQPTALFKSDSSKNGG